MMKITSTNQQGAALIVALFVTALVAIMAVTMIETIRVHTYRDTLILHATQSKLYTAGSIAWAKDELNRHWIQQKKDQIIDSLPIQSPVDKIENATIVTQIEDGQARFNLNSLSNPEMMEPFTRLIRLVNPTITEETAKSIALATADWISPENAAAYEPVYKK